MAITTNREYLKASLSKFGVSDTEIDLIVVEHPELEDEMNVRACKLAIYESMPAFIPVSDVSEGGYSVTWDVERLKMWFASICKDLGKPNPYGSTVSNRSNYW